MDANVDVEFANFKRSNPNMDSPYARLLAAILLNAVHDAVAAQSSATQKQQAWKWLEEDDVLIDYCLSVVRLDRDVLLRRVRYMRNHDINLKNMYTKRKSL